jgi:hypothetical protein
MQSFCYYLYSYKTPWDACYLPKTLKKPDFEAFWSRSGHCQTRCASDHTAAQVCDHLGKNKSQNTNSALSNTLKPNPSFQTIVGSR